MSDLTAKQVFDALNRPNESDNYSDFLTKDELRAAKVLLDDIHSSSPLVAELISKRSEIANQTNDEWFWESSVSRADFEKYFEAANQTSRERERRHSVLNDPSSEATLARVSQGKLAGKAFQELSHWTGSISKDDTKHLVEQLRERKDETSAIVLTTLSNNWSTLVRQDKFWQPDNMMIKREFIKFIMTGVSGESSESAAARTAFLTNLHNGTRFSDLPGRGQLRQESQKNGRPYHPLDKHLDPFYDVNPMNQLSPWR